MLVEAGVVEPGVVQARVVQARVVELRLVHGRVGGGVPELGLPGVHARGVRPGLVPRALVPLLRHLGVAGGARVPGPDVPLGAGLGVLLGGDAGRQVIAGGAPHRGVVGAGVVMGGVVVACVVVARFVRPGVLLVDGGPLRGVVLTAVGALPAVVRARKRAEERVAVAVERVAVPVGGGEVGEAAGGVAVVPGVAVRCVLVLTVSLVVRIRGVGSGDGRRGPRRVTVVHHQLLFRLGSRRISGDCTRQYAAATIFSEF